MNVKLAQETYEPKDDAGVAKIYDFLEAHERSGRERPTPQFFLAGSTPGDQVQIPEEVHLVLRQVIEAMKLGLSVTVAPQSKTLTTQQAADLLNVSRPTIVKILDSGAIPFEKTGTHRRIRLQDLLTFREARRKSQYEALEAMSLGVDASEPIDEVLSELKAARKALAARRRRS